MENASKALLIAGSILIVIIILSFAAYLFRNTASDKSRIYDQMSDTEIAEYNQKFFNYQKREGDLKVDSNGNITNALNIHDVVSVINLAKNYNETGKYPVQVKVTLGSEDLLKKDNLADFIKTNINSKYLCEVNFEPNTKFVGTVNFTEKRQ